MNDTPVEAGQILGSKYELVDQIGSGPLGPVWSVRQSDTEPPQLLAAKVLRADLANDANVVGRLVRQRVGWMKLRHPNIVEVVATVAQGDHLAIVMELVPGVSLAQVLDDQATLTQEQVLALAGALLSALAAAHDQKVLHKDLKPSNILFGSRGLDAPGEAKVGGFGVSALVGSIEISGFTAPELLGGGRPSAAADVYSAGAVLYQAITGNPPARQTTSGHHQMASTPPALPIEANCWPVIESMLAPQPADRPSAAQAYADLAALSAPTETPAETLEDKPISTPVALAAPLVGPADEPGPAPALTQDASASPTLVAQAPTAPPPATAEPAPSTPPTNAKAEVAAPAITEEPKPKPQSPGQPDKDEQKRRRRPWLIPLFAVAVAGIIIGVIISALAGWWPGKGTATPPPIDTVTVTSWGNLPPSQTISDPIGPTTDVNSPSVTDQPSSTPTSSHQPTTANPTGSGAKSSPPSSKPPSSTSTKPPSSTSTSRPPSSTSSRPPSSTSSRPPSSSSTTTSVKPAVTAAFSNPSSGTTASNFTFTVMTNQPARMLVFEISGLGTYYISDNGSLTPSRWGSTAVGVSNGTTWTVSNIKLEVGNWAVKVSALDAGGTTLATASFTVTVH